MPYQVAGRAVLILALLIGPVLSHSFYDPYCCNGTDCSPISDDRVQVVSTGYLIDGKHHVPLKEARRSQDGDYHACFYPTPDILRCFYAPPMGS